MKITMKLMAMLAVVLTRLDRDELESFAQGLVKAGMSGEVLVDAGKQVAFIWGSRVAKGFLARMAAHLKASEVREIQAESKAANPVGDDVADLLRDAGKLLEPAFDLDSCAAFDDDDDDDDDDDYDDCDDPFGAWGEMPELSRRDLIEGAREVLRHAGVSEERIRRVPPEILQGIGSAVNDLSSGHAMEAKLRALVSAIQLAGFRPEDLPGMFAEETGGAPGRRRR